MSSEPFLVVAGSYEKLLYGLSGTFEPAVGAQNARVSLKPTFIFPAHNACIKTVAVSPNGAKWLATGSTDEVIKIWSLRQRKEVGGLVQHDGSITQLAFPTRSHLISASDDGTICLFHARDWSLLRTLKGHKGSVHSVAVHPSSKLALSVGKDRTMRMWDLMRGKGSASIKLTRVLSQSTVDVYATDLSLISSLNLPARLHDLKFCDRSRDQGQELLLVAAEDKIVYVYGLEAQATAGEPLVLLARLVGHTNRVKGLDVLQVSLPSADVALAVTASSDGHIRVFDLAGVPAKAPSQTADITPLASYDTKGTRLTCVAFGALGVAAPEATGKRKRLPQDEGDRPATEEDVSADDGNGGDDDDASAASSNVDSEE